MHCESNAYTRGTANKLCKKKFSHPIQMPLEVSIPIALMCVYLCYTTCSMYKIFLQHFHFVTKYSVYCQYEQFDCRNEIKWLGFVHTVRCITHCKNNVKHSNSNIFQATKSLSGQLISCLLFTVFGQHLASSSLLSPTHTYSEQHKCKIIACSKNCTENISLPAHSVQNSVAHLKQENVWACWESISLLGVKC